MRLDGERASKRGGREQRQRGNNGPVRGKMGTVHNGRERKGQSPFSRERVADETQRMVNVRRKEKTFAKKKMFQNCSTDGALEQRDTDEPRAAGGRNPPKAEPTQSRNRLRQGFAGQEGRKERNRVGTAEAFVPLLRNGPCPFPVKTFVDLSLSRGVMPRPHPALTYTHPSHLHSCAKGFLIRAIDMPPGG